MLKKFIRMVQFEVTVWQVWLPTNAPKRKHQVGLHFTCSKIWKQLEVHHDDMMYRWYCDKVQYTVTVSKLTLNLDVTLTRQYSNSYSNITLLLTMLKRRQMITSWRHIASSGHTGQIFNVKNTYSTVCTCTVNRFACLAHLTKSDSLHHLNPQLSLVLKRAVFCS